MEENALTFLPISLRAGNILIVGGGRVATHKAGILRRYTRDARIIGASLSDEIKRLGFEYEERPIEKEDIRKARIVFICTGDRELNRELKEEAERWQVLASVCDDPELCDFTSPAICSVDGGVTIAVASDARDVRRSIRIRDRIRELIENGALSTE